MKVFSPMVLTILTATTLLFTGCSTDANGVDRDPVIQTEATQPHPDPLPQEDEDTPQPEPTHEEQVEAPTPPHAVKSENIEVDEVSLAADTTEENVISKVPEEQIVAFLEAINAARAETQDCGSEGVFDPAAPLTWNNRLGNAAWEHTNDLALSNTFSHHGSGTQSDITAQELALDRGSHFDERIEHHGYTDYRLIGENVAAGYATAQEAIEGWLASDYHCATLMNPKFTEVGMAHAQKTGSEYGDYWSQEFGGK